MANKMNEQSGMKETQSTSTNLSQKPADKANKGYERESSSSKVSERSSRTGSSSSSSNSSSEEEE